MPFGGFGMCCCGGTPPVSCLSATTCGTCATGTTPDYVDVTLTWSPPASGPCSFLSSGVYRLYRSTSPFTSLSCSWWKYIATDTLSIPLVPACDGQLVDYYLSFSIQAGGSPYTVIKQAVYWRIIQDRGLAAGCDAALTEWLASAVPGYSPVDCSMDIGGTLTKQTTPSGCAGFAPTTVSVTPCVGSYS